MESELNSKDLKAQIKQRQNTKHCYRSIISETVKGNSCSVYNGSWNWTTRQLESRNVQYPLSATWWYTMTASCLHLAAGCLRKVQQSCFKQLLCVLSAVGVNLSQSVDISLVDHMMPSLKSTYQCHPSSLYENLTPLSVSGLLTYALSHTHTSHTPSVT